MIHELREGGVRFESRLPRVVMRSPGRVAPRARWVTVNALACRFWANRDSAARAVAHVDSAVAQQPAAGGAGSADDEAGSLAPSSSSLMLRAARRHLTSLLQTSSRTRCSACSDHPRVRDAARPRLGLRRRGGRGSRKRLGLSRRARAPHAPATPPAAAAASTLRRADAARRRRVPAARSGAGHVVRRSRPPPASPGRAPIPSTLRARPHSRCRCRRAARGGALGPPGGGVTSMSRAA